MRPLLFAAALALVADPALAADGPPAPAEARPPRPNAVQLDLGLGVVGLAYERFFLPRVAVQLEAHVFGTWFGPIFDLPNMRGLGGQIRPSFFVTEDGPRGVYVAPFLRIARVSTEVNGSEGDAIGYSTGAFLGYAFLIAERVNLRVGAGLQFMSYEVETRGGTASFRTLFPALDAVVGYVF